jgi:hypothetical protein
VRQDDGDGINNCINEALFCRVRCQTAIVWIPITIVLEPFMQKYPFQYAIRILVLEPTRDIVTNYQPTASPNLHIVLWVIHQTLQGIPDPPTILREKVDGIVLADAFRSISISIIRVPKTAPTAFQMSPGKKQLVDVISRMT